MATNKGKGGPVKKETKAVIIKKLTTLIKSSKIDHTNYESIAKTFNTTRQTISNYISEIYESVPEEEINKVMIDFRIIFEKLEHEVNEALSNACTVKEKLEVIRTYFQYIKERTDFMEKFFIKQKVADKVEITSLNINIDIEAESNSILSELNG